MKNKFTHPEPSSIINCKLNVLLMFLGHPLLMKGNLKLTSPTVDEKGACAV